MNEIYRIYSKLFRVEVQGCVIQITEKRYIYILYIYRGAFNYIFI